MSFSTSSSPCSYRLDLFWVKTAAHCVTLLIPCTMWRSSSLKHCLCPLINKTRFSFYFFDPCLPAEQKFPSITAPAWDPSPFLLLISTKWRWVLCGILIRREKQLGLKPWEFEREKYLQEHKVKVFFFFCLKVLQCCSIHKNWCEKEQCSSQKKQDVYKLGT